MIAARPRDCNCKMAPLPDVSPKPLCPKPSSLGPGKRPLVVVDNSRPAKKRIIVAMPPPPVLFHYDLFVKNKKPVAPVVQARPQKALLALAVPMSSHPFKRTAAVTSKAPVRPPPPSDAASCIDAALALASISHQEKKSSPPGLQQWNNKKATRKVATYANHRYRSPAAA